MHCDELVAPGSGNVELRGRADVSGDRSVRAVSTWHPIFPGLHALLTVSVLWPAIARQVLLWLDHYEGTTDADAAKIAEHIVRDDDDDDG